MDIELYDLETDIQEENNVAAEFPDIVSTIETIMKDARTTPHIKKFKMGPLGDADVESSKR